VIRAYQIVKKYNDCILILAGSPASDDPEGQIVLSDTREAAVAIQISTSFCCLLLAIKT